MEMQERVKTMQKEVAGRDADLLTLKEEKAAVEVKLLHQFSFLLNSPNRFFN